MPESNDWITRKPLFPGGLRTDQPHAARIYDVMLGGKTNYPADREFVEWVVAALPTAIAGARDNRAFMRRAVRHLAAEAGIRQFLDIGAGIPSSPNLHEVVQSVDPAARVVYADNDPIVLTHSRALHSSTPQGRICCVQADATDPRALLDSPELRETLDLDQPVALSLCLLLHWLPRDCDVHEVVRVLLDALPAGSALVLSHATQDFDRELLRLTDQFTGSGAQVVPRTRSEIARFFDGLELLDPGIAVPRRWRPEADEPVEPPSEGEASIWAGVAFKRS